VGRARWSKTTVDVIRAGIEAGLKKPTATLGFLELGARVLDKTDDTQGKVVHFHLHTNVDIYALGKAREQHGAAADCAAGGSRVERMSHPIRLGSGLDLLADAVSWRSGAWYLPA
jgi:hypothetical protein